MSSSVAPDDALNKAPDERARAIAETSEELEACDPDPPDLVTQEHERESERSLLKAIELLRSDLKAVLAKVHIITWYALLLLAQTAAIAAIIKWL